jgi:predicted dehydrogenase
VADTSADQIAVGILGLGRSGWDIHADAVEANPSFRVAAVADPVADRRTEAEQRFGCQSFADPAELITSADVDVIVVATPSDSHVPLTVAALQGGRHVVVEKPMAQNAAGVDEMISAARDANRILTCYQPRRLDADFLAIREIVEAGGIGELILVRRTIHSFARRADWQMLRRYDGGALSNTVPHLLDQALQFVDPETELDLLADLRHTIGAGDAEDHAMLTLRPRGGGPLLQVEASSAVALPQPQWTIIGTAGAISGSPTDLTLRRTDPSAWAPITAAEGPAEGRRYGTGEELEWTETKINTEGTGPAPVQLFYDRLEPSLRGTADVFVTPESIRRQIMIIAEARQQTGLL